MPVTAFGGIFFSQTCKVRQLGAVTRCSLQGYIEGQGPSGATKVGCGGF